MEEEGAAPAPDADQRSAVVLEGAVDAEKHAQASTAPMPQEAVATEEQHVDGVTVPMVTAPEEAVGVDHRVEGSTVPMVVPQEEAVGVDKRAEGSTVVTDEAVDMEHHAEGSTVPMVAPPEEAVGADQASPVPMVVHKEEAVATEQQRVEASAPTPVVTPEVAADGDHHIHIEDATTQDKHGDTVGTINVAPEEMRGIIQVIADTGKFWHEWSYLKKLLSLQLMQVLGEYSEAQIVMPVDGQQPNSLSAETNSELFSQLNNALLRFEEGPPFTLQRLCEILLDPKGTYKKLPKLALALEKTLLVTSTIPRCTDPYPAAAAAHGLNPEATTTAENTGAAYPAEPAERPSEQRPAAVPNGTEHAGGGDGDEEMADAEDGSSHGDVEMQQEEEKPDQIVDGVGSGSTTSAATAAIAPETVVGATEQSPDPQS